MPETESALNLKLDGVTLTYPNGIRALDGVSLSAPHGQFLAVIGPNGSGKSTLLRAIAGLQPLDSGTLFLDGQLIDTMPPLERSRRVALVPQSLEIQPGYSVEDFVLGGRYSHLSGWRLFSKHDHAVAHESLKQVDAFQFLNRGMDEMSGGERQRVLIARALAQETRTILLDEPTSALDIQHQLMVYRLIHGLQKIGKRSVVVVTHDLNLASQFADRLLLMCCGKVMGEGTPAEVLRPEFLARVYNTDLAYGVFGGTVSGGGRPWVLPWAKDL